MSFLVYGGNMHQILLLILVSLLQLFLTIEDIAGRRYIRFAIDGILLLAELFYCGILITIDHGYDGAEACVFPAAVLWMLELALLIYAAVSHIGTVRRMKYSLSRESVKEGLDNLPDGVCFFDEYGAMRLINRKMLSVNIMLFGNEIQTLHELHEALYNPPATVECMDGSISLYRFPDGTVRRFTEYTHTDADGSAVTEVIASDVTELYEKQKELSHENARLAEANRSMKRILDNMSEIVREKEILSMKMRIHDDIGHSILSAKKALLQQQSIATIRENAALWETAIGLLDRANHMPPLPDEWETVKARAGELGVEIVLDGELPEYKLLRHLLILAVRECMTNCVRHAGGDKLFVALLPDGERIACVITNNGKAPEQTIVEGGGLSGLRRRIEREGGIMKLQSSPRFALTVILPSKEEPL